MVIECTHSKQMNWLLPGLAPTNKKLKFPLIAVVRFKNRKIHHEHIWWDQATIFKQLGLIPDGFPAKTFGSETADQLIKDSERIKH